MKVSSIGVRNGIIDDKYGQFGTQFLDGMPTYSLPFDIQDVPEGTKAFAVVLDDKDAIPVAGFDWIHWLIANLKQTSLPENVSIRQDNDFIQGLSSWNVPLYGGMMPPDRAHTYDLTVYALDTELPLKTGFSYDELMVSMQGHIIAEAETHGIYPSIKDEVI